MPTPTRGKNKQRNANKGSYVMRGVLVNWKIMQLMKFNSKIEVKCFENSHSTSQTVNHTITSLFANIRHNTTVSWLSGVQPQKTL